MWCAPFRGRGLFRAMSWQPGVIVSPVNATTWERANKVYEVGGGGEESSAFAMSAAAKAKSSGGFAHGLVEASKRAWRCRYVNLNNLVTDDPGRVERDDFSPLYPQPLGREPQSLRNVTGNPVRTKNPKPHHTPNHLRHIFFDLAPR